MTAAPTWEEYVAAGEALDRHFSDTVPMPEGATSGDYWTPVPGQSGLYFREINWPSIWSDDESVVASVIGRQYSDGRPIDRQISFDCNDTEGKEQMVAVTFAAATRLAQVLLEVASGERPAEVSADLVR